MSFETDILQNYVGTDSGISKNDLAGFFSFLSGKGMKRDNYDVVLLYTGAPMWCSTDLAKAGMKGLWKILS